MKNIVILGSTGSIGQNTLSVTELPDSKYKVFGLAVHSNIELLAKQVEHYRPKFVAVFDEKAFIKAKQLFGQMTQVLCGMEGIRHMVSHPETDFVMAAMVGSIGIEPFIWSLEADKQIGLANKEVLVLGGEYLNLHYNDRMKRQVLPVDSEHSAIFQCLEGHNMSTLESIYLTASGGPFLNRNDLENVSVEDALKHPNWKMGSKITIDSASLMNKGLELIEARWLFDTPVEKIKVVIHPQSIVHSMVCFHDGSFLAHLGTPDMRIPISIALHYPERISTPYSRLQFDQWMKLEFGPPDLKRFPCLGLAMEAIKKSNIFPAVLNAANEVAVHAFLENKISFGHIPGCVSEVMSTFSAIENYSISALLETDKEARVKAREWITKRY